MEELGMENIEHLRGIGEAMREVSAALGLPVEWLYVGAFLAVMVPWLAVWWGAMNHPPRDHCHECTEHEREQFAKFRRAIKRGAVWSWSKVWPWRARATATP